MINLGRAKSTGRCPGVSLMPTPNLAGYWLSRAVRVDGAAAAECLRAHRAELGQPYGVTPPQWALLIKLAANGECTVTGLSQALAVETPPITGILTRLEQNGLVERVHDLDARRVVNVSLTNEGEHFVRALNPVISQFNEWLAPPEEAPEFTARLKELIARVAELAPEKAMSALMHPFEGAKEL
jgi:DNA-binding MarR family transcriptional regulator